MFLFRVEEHYECPGADDPEQLTRCCEAASCCAPSDSNISGIVISAALGGLNILLLAILSRLYWTRIKNVSLKPIIKRPGNRTDVKYNRA